MFLLLEMFENTKNVPFLLLEKQIMFPQQCFRRKANRGTLTGNIMFPQLVCPGLKKFAILNYSIFVLQLYINYSTNFNTSLSQYFRCVIIIWLYEKVAKWLPIIY